ncbi:MAG: methionyl-tRNA formyltransferase [Methylococcaceae bacterium]|nr:methionyl-tRNA formyltransferase [Methylococcaceae bacterium]
MKNRRLSIGYFADGIWAHAAFHLLVGDPSLKIRFVCVRYDSQDQLLRELASAHGIPVLRHPNINSHEFLRRMRESGSDMFVSMSFNQIFGKEILKIPSAGTINCHAGKLPFYRGRNVLNWALINDEKEFGITVHYVDEGIDTGDILAQKCFPITDEDNYASLLSTAHQECAIILYETINLLRLGTATRTRQSDIHPVGFYCGIRKEGDEKLDWNQTSREVFNFIRSICHPGPKALCFLEGEAIRINSARLIPHAPAYRGIPGQIVGKTANGFIAKTVDSTVEITNFTFDGKIRVGDRLK